MTASESAAAASAYLAMAVCGAHETEFDQDYRALAASIDTALREYREAALAARQAYNNLDGFTRCDIADIGSVRDRYSAALEELDRLHIQMPEGYIPPRNRW